MRIGEKESTGSGWRGIWRASVPVNTDPDCLLSPKRRSRPKSARSKSRWLKPPAPILSALFTLIVFMQASALPTHIGLLMIPFNTPAMTHGCEKGTCCTQLCYLDKHGTHHCVHMSGDSCECGVSDGDDCTANPIFLSAVIVLFDTDALMPDLTPARWNQIVSIFFTGREPAIPIPPPKSADYAKSA